jgi:hypothetical protein
MTQHFGYAVDRRYLPLLLPFGFKPGRGSPVPSAATQT